MDLLEENIILEITLLGSVNNNQQSLIELCIYSGISKPKYSRIDGVILQESTSSSFLLLNEFDDSP